MSATLNADAPPSGKPQISFTHSSIPVAYTPPLHVAMPVHWKGHFDGKRSYTIILEFVFKTLCVLSFGSRNLDILWSKIGNAETDPNEFVAYKDRVIRKMSTVTVVVSN